MWRMWRVLNDRPLHQGDPLRRSKDLMIMRYMTAARRVDDPLDELLSLRDAARLMGRSADTLRSAARRGTLNARQLGGFWVTDRTSVGVYMATRRR